MTVTRVKRLINPTRRRPKAKARRVVKSRRNPASIITLGLVNPTRKATKGRKKMATKTKRRKTTARASNPARRRNRRHAVAAAPVRRQRSSRHRVRNPRRRARRNGTRITVVRRSHRNGRKRNPEMFGMRGAAAGKAILAGLVGVYATKTVTPMVANAIPSIGGSAIISAIVSAAIAWGGGMLVSKWDKAAGEGFMFGGLMQAGSQLLNLVVPTNPLSLAGLGDFVSIAPTGFPVPSNDIRRAMLARGAAPTAAAPSGNLAGMGAAASFR